MQRPLSAPAIRYLPPREATENSRTAGNFPAARSRPGETPQEALVREIREELDAEIQVGEKIDCVEYDYPAFHLSMECFWARIRSGELTLKEHEAARWLSREELDSVDWLPADLSLIRKIREQMQAEEGML